MRHPDKTINAFLSILDRPRGFRQVVFAGEGRATGGMNYETGGLLEFLVGGRQRVHFYRQGRIVSHVLNAGELFFVPPGHPYRVDWEYDCRRIGIVAGEFGRLAMSWHNHTAEHSRVVTRSDLWYTAEIREELDIPALFAVMTARIGHPADSKLSCELGVMMIRRIVEHLQNGGRGLPGRSAYHTFQQVSSYLETNCREPVSRKELALKFGVHPDYITKLFREYAHCGFSEYLLRLRMSNAQWYLHNTGLTVQEIAGICGFYDAGHFIKRYRAQYHTSPGRGRK